MPHSRAVAAPVRTPETERCAHCLQTYAYEMAVRCERCDGVACAFCAVRSGRAGSLVCPSCRRDPDGAAPASRER